jgi:hypothetical protein
VKDNIMTTEPPAAAVALRAPANLYAGLPPFGLPARETARAPAGDGAIVIGRASLPHGLGRLVSVLGDLVGLVAVAFAFPLVILAIGIPLALLVRLVMWLVGVL